MILCLFLLLRYHIKSIIKMMMAMHIIIPTIQPATIPPTPEEESSSLVCLSLETLTSDDMNGVVVGSLLGITLEDVMLARVIVADIISVDIMSVDDGIVVDVLAAVILVDIISINATMVDVTSKDFTLAGVTMVGIPGTVEQYN